MGQAQQSQMTADPRAQALVSGYERAGYARIAPAILQPAEPFLDLGGEDIRSRMFLTANGEGEEFCLRPDLTIPVSRDYLASPQAGSVQGYCYLGPVFRDRGNGSNEFIQAGIESFGRKDIAAADAEMLALALEATSQFGVGAPQVRSGDVGLFSALVAALDLNAAWKRRLVKDFNRKADLAQDLDQLTLATNNAQPEYQGVLAAITGSDPKAAHALVADLLSIAGITTVGGRSVDEIADRFLEQATMGASATLPREMRQVVERFLAISGNPDDAAVALRKLAEDAGLALDAAIDLFENRTGFLAARGIDVSQIEFSSAFGRGLDYYTGFVFELHEARAHLDGPLVAGGRYDSLLSRLGASEAIPAVGFSAWIERLVQAGGAA